MKKAIYLIFVLFGLSQLTHANTTGIKEGNKISGHVIEHDTEENIAFASILIIETGEGTMSNEQGQFVFNDLAPGKYTLRASAI